MKINLHIGAHKTATTYLQSVLEANAPALNASGIGFIPLNTLRKSFTRKLMKLDPASFDFGSMEKTFFLHERPAKVSGVILSDENLIGACGNFVDSGELYREAPARLRHLRSLLEGHEISLFFSIRSYDTFIASAYCEALRNRRTFVPFGEFWRRVKMQRCRWPKIFASFQEALQPKSVTVWRYEDFRPNAEAIMRKLAFDTAQPLNTGASAAERASFSGKAIEILQLLAAKCEPDVLARLIEPIGNSLPKRDGFPSFYPFDLARKARLQRLYEEDCAEFPVSLMAFPSQADTDEPSVPEERAA